MEIFNTPDIKYRNCASAKIIDNQTVMSGHRLDLLALAACICKRIGEEEDSAFLKHMAEKIKDYYKLSYQDEYD